MKMHQPLVVAASAASAANGQASDCSSPLSSPPPSSKFRDLYFGLSPSTSPLHLPSSLCISSPPVPIRSSARLTPPPSHDTALQNSRHGSEEPTHDDDECDPAPSCPSEMAPTTRSMRARAGTAKPTAAVKKEAVKTPQRKGARKRTASAVEDKKPSKASPSEAAAAKRLKREAARWHVDSVLSYKGSPLGNYDIRSMLCNPEAWTVLSKEEQKEVIALFPSDQHILDPDTDDARPNIPSLRNDDNFRTDCARYQSDLKNGLHDKLWLEEAFEAHELRKTGFFDEFVVATFENDWGIQVPDEHKPASMRQVADAEEPPKDEQGGEAAAESAQDVKKSGSEAVTGRDRVGAEKEHEGPQEDENKDLPTKTNPEENKDPSVEGVEVILGSPLPEAGD